MDRKRQRELALGGTAVLLIVVAAWSMQRDTSTPAGTAGANTTRASNAPGSKIAITEVDLKALEVERPEPEGGTRNPFRFKSRPAPPPPSATIIKKQQEAAAAAQVAVPPPGPPPPPRIPLKYIGDMMDPKNTGKRIAILSDARGTYYGRENEVIEGRYRIVRIGVESIELAYLDGRGRQTIRQTGQ